MTGPRIVLILDHPERDLAGLVLLAHELCQRGATCHIVPMNIKEQEVWSLAPDFVLLNFVRRGNEDFVRQLVRAGIGFGVLDTEGGVWDTPRSYSSMLWSDRDLLHRADVACMWGARLAEHVVDEGIFLQPQIAVTGCPRFDFYHPGWRDAMAEPCGNGTAPVLINTNFSFANPRFVTVEQNIVQLRDEIGWTHERAMEQAETEQEAVARIIELARALSVDYPETRVVLRPHPFENPETYRSALADRSNVSLNVGGPVQPQIFRSAAVIQRGCSTAIESAMAGVPTLSPRWFSIAGLAPMTEAVSDPCETYGELREKVGAILARAYEPPAGLRESVAGVIGDWFCAADGQSHQRAADAILACVPAPRAVDLGRCRRYLYGLDDHASGRILERLPRAMRMRLGLPAEWSFTRFRVVPRRSFARSDKHFTADRVAGIVSRIRKAPGMSGRARRPVTVGLARERGEMRHGYQGFAVSVAPQ